jgi:hypothetical protein
MRIMQRLIFKNQSYVGILIAYSLPAERVWIMPGFYYCPQIIFEPLQAQRAQRVYKNRQSIVLEREGSISCTKIKRTQLTCRGAPRGYPRVEELVLLPTGARCEIDKFILCTTIDSAVGKTVHMRLTPNTCVGK